MSGKNRILNTNTVKKDRVFYAKNPPPKEIEEEGIIINEGINEV